MTHGDQDPLAPELYGDALDRYEQMQINHAARPPGAKERMQRSRLADAESEAPLRRIFNTPFGSRNWKRKPPKD